MVFPSWARVGTAAVSNTVSINASAKTAKGVLFVTIRRVVVVVACFIFFSFLLGNAFATAKTFASEA